MKKNKYNKFATDKYINLTGEFLEKTLKLSLNNGFFLSTDIIEITRQIKLNNVVDTVSIDNSGYNINTFKKVLDSIAGKTGIKDFTLVINNIFSNRNISKDNKLDILKSLYVLTSKNTIKVLYLDLEGATEQIYQKLFSPLSNLDSYQSDNEYLSHILKNNPQIKTLNIYATDIFLQNNYKFFEETSSLQCFEMYIDADEPEVLSDLFEVLAKKNKLLRKLILKGDLAYEDATEDEIAKVNENFSDLISKNKFLTKIKLEDTEFSNIGKDIEILSVLKDNYFLLCTNNFNPSLQTLINRNFKLMSSYLKLPDKDKAFLAEFVLNHDFTTLAPNSSKVVKDFYNLLDTRLYEMLFNKDSTGSNIAKDSWFEIFSFLPIAKKLNIIKTGVLKLINNKDHNIKKHIRDDTEDYSLLEQNDQKKYKAANDPLAFNLFNFSEDANNNDKGVSGENTPASEGNDS